MGQFVRLLTGITCDELKPCVDEGIRTSRRLGEVLRSRGLVSREQLSEVFRHGAQWVAQAAYGEFAPEGLPYPAFFSLCMPAYNEAENIVDTLDAACAILPEFVRDYEVIVVNDGSADQTGDLLREYHEKEPRVRVVTHEKNQGYGAAVTSGLRAARGDLVSFMDSDGQFSLLDLPRLLVRMKDNDVVVGYRCQRADPWPRRLNAWSWGRLVWTLLGVDVRDLDCAFKIFRRPVIDALKMTSTGACINAQIMAQCVRGGLRIAETPVFHYPRNHGAATGANLKVILRAFRELPRIRRECRAESAQAFRERALGLDSTTSVGRVSSFETSSQPHDAWDLEAPGTDNPLTICMLAACPFPANHGTPGSIREMAEAISERGHDVQMVTYHMGENIAVDGPTINRIPALTRESSVVVGPTIRRPLYDLQMVFKTLKVIREKNCNVIHAHGYEAALVAWVCRALTGIPVVYSAHNTMADELPTYRFIRPKWLARLFGRFLDSIVPRLSDVCIPHSENSRKFLYEKGLAARTEPVVHHGIDVAAIAGGDAASIRRQYGIKEDPVVLYAGVLDQFQRLDLLLEAMVVVLKKKPTARLLVVLTIPNEKQEAELRAKAHELGISDRLIVTEPQLLDAIPDYLQACDVAVVPRPGAPGFPIKVMNYMSANKPTVLFSSSASSGFVHRQNAMLVDSDTGEAFGEAILEVLDDDELRHRIADNGHQFVLEHFDRRQTAAKVCRAYVRTLKQAGKLPKIKQRTRSKQKVS